jgi:hypothetical protein
LIYAKSMEKRPISSNFVKNKKIPNSDILSQTGCNGKRPSHATVPLKRDLSIGITFHSFKFPFDNTNYL